MLWVPQKGIIRVDHNTGSAGAANPGTAVTTGASSSTKGTPAELITSTAFDSYWMTVIASNFGLSATASEAALDILVGAATEDVLIANLLYGYAGGNAGSTSGPRRWDFPLYIPAGTRIAAQAASARVSSNVRVLIYLYGGHSIPPFRVGTRVTTYGMGTVPNGTTITPGASNAEGSWTQITASTSEDHFCLSHSFQPSADTTINNLTQAVDIGVGSATEEEVAGQYWYRTDSAEHIEGPWNTMPAFVDVPAGSRLVMRASNSGVNDGGYNGVIHAVS